MKEAEERTVLADYKW